MIKDFIIGSVLALSFCLTSLSEYFSIGLCGIAITTLVIIILGFTKYTMDHELNQFICGFLFILGLSGFFINPLSYSIIFLSIFAIIEYNLLFKIDKIT